jgi:MarR family transcriptional regulator for hemolysin
MEKLEKVFFYHLEKAIKSYRQFAQSQLKKNSFHITVDQWLLLKTLHDEPGINQVAIAERVFKDKASITRMIQALEESGFIVRDILASDKRQMHLSITSAGKDLIHHITPIVLSYRNAALNGISEQELLIAEKVMKTIAQNSKDNS